MMCFTHILFRKRRYLPVSRLLIPFVLMVNQADAITAKQIQNVLYTHPSSHEEGSSCQQVIDPVRIQDHYEQIKEQLFRQ